MIKRHLDFIFRYLIKLEVIVQTQKLRILIKDTKGVKQKYFQTWKNEILPKENSISFYCGTSSSKSLEFSVLHY